MTYSFLQVFYSTYKIITAHVAAEFFSIEKSSLAQKNRQDKETSKVIWFRSKELSI